MKRMASILVVVAALGAQGLGAQETPRARAQRTLAPAVYEDLSTLVTSFEGSGIPEDPLFAKALEGAAKRVPQDRLVPAVREYAGRLGVARDALGPGADVSLLVAGADALQRGVNANTLRMLPADRPRSPMAVLVLAELVESGVPTDRALAIVRDAMAQRTQDARILDMSARIRMLIRQGVAPADAIERVRALYRDRAMNAGPAVPPGSEPISSDTRRVR